MSLSLRKNLNHKPVIILLLSVFLYSFRQFNRENGILNKVSKLQLFDIDEIESNSSNKICK